MFEPLHTHDSTGIIHIEATSYVNYTIGQFFQVWAATYPTVTVNGTTHPVIFNDTDILGFKADATHQVVLLVDGKPYTGNFDGLILDNLDYCSSANQSVLPCSLTAGGNPGWRAVRTILTALVTR